MAAEFEPLLKEAARYMKNSIFDDRAARKMKKAALIKGKDALERMREEFVPKANKILDKYDLFIDVWKRTYTSKTNQGGYGAVYRDHDVYIRIYERNHPLHSK